MGQLSKTISEFVAGSRVSSAPKKARDIAARGFTDCVAVMIAGHGEPVVNRLKNYAHEQQGVAESRVLFQEPGSPSSHAALVGTAAAHALDFDDYAFANHPSALLVPAILAEGERLGRSGRELIDAYLIGFECWAAVMKREPDHLHSKGWHPTGIFGPIGVAAAICHLNGANETIVKNALGLAAANGGGIMDNFGTDAKAFQGARASEAGITSSRLALNGVTAGEDAVDGSGGLLAALSPNGKVDLTSSAEYLGHDWYIEEHGINFKRHPTVGASQRAIDAAIQLHDDHAVAVESIASIVARVGAKHAAVMRFSTPASALEAKFSLEFGVAAGLLAGRVSLAELTDDFVTSEEMISLMQKVTVEIGPDDDPIYGIGAASDHVSLTLHDGQEFESELVTRARGHGLNPMTDGEFLEKFLDCTNGAISDDLSRSLFSQILDLDELSDASTLIDAIQQALHDSSGG